MIAVCKLHGGLSKCEAALAFLDPDMIAHPLEQARADAPNREQLVHFSETSLPFAMLDDASRKHRADSGKTIELLDRGPIEIHHRDGGARV